MSNSTRIVLMALAGATLVSTVACIITKKTSAHPSAQAPISFTSSSTLTPWAGTCALSYSSSSDSASCTISVPDNEEIVIKTISGQELRPAPSQLSTKVSAVSGGYSAYWYNVPAALTTTAGTDEYLWSAPVTLYADPGSSITITVINVTGALLSVPAGNGITLVGYYVTSSAS